MKALKPCARRNEGNGGIRKGSVWRVDICQTRALGVEEGEEARTESFSIRKSNSITNSSYRERKLLIMVPSTPVMNEGPIGNGKDVADGRCGSDLDEEATGMSKEIFVIATWSRTSSIGNLLVISLFAT